MKCFKNSILLYVIHQWTTLDFIVVNLFSSNRPFIKYILLFLQKFSKKLPTLFLVLSNDFLIFRTLILCNSKILDKQSRSGSAKSYSWFEILSNSIKSSLSEVLELKSPVKQIWLNLLFKFKNSSLISLNASLELYTEFSGGM